MPEEDPEATEQEPQDLQQIREALKRERARRVELETQVPDLNVLKKENTMLRAGIDTTSALGELFSKAYEGELEVDAVKDAWAKIAPAPRGSEPPSEQMPTPGPNPGDAEDQRRAAAEAQALHSEATPPGEEPETPLGMAMMNAAFAQQGGVRARPTGGMSDRSMEAGLNVLFERVAKGDPQAVYKRADESWNSAKDRFDRR
jgi:hypothetical protein